MTRRRLHFNEPIVRAKVSRIRFPKTCPVCGAPASKVTRISTNLGRKVWLRPYFAPRYNLRSTTQMTNAETKSFLVDVCEDHSVSDNAEMRMRSLASIIASIVAGISIFALIYAGADYWVGRQVSPWIYSYLLILGISLFFVYIAFRPSALEASFRIIGFDFDLQYVWFAMSNPMYRSLFVKENPLDAELVSWIVKV
ncbi:MAG: hypothetical protein ThorAB25_07720 [Candidatus Thorarchaeota archaeon AB_25]|nr:MAG: hypothetical protein ThorAB25_07720 [Candidatus Thorarchaeota archaeon AB_25]